MLSLKDFKEFAIEHQNVIKGGFYGYSYECNNGSGGFSTVGETLDIHEIKERCGSDGATVTQIP